MCFRSVKFWYVSGSSDSYLGLTDPDPDPALLNSDLFKTPTKICFSLSFYAYSFLKVHLRGVLGNKCAGQHNLKTEEIRKIM